MLTNHRFATEALRTVAVVGHGAAGKTTLVEQLLAKSGMIGAAGSVERGTTVSDHDPQEKAVLHSLRASVVHCDHAAGSVNARIHLIDTPGYPDFIGQAIGALDAVETVMVVVSATGGIELVTRRMMDWARRRNLCRMIVVNKIDHDNIRLPQLLAELRETFGAEVLPINLPADGGARVIDCFDKDSGAADFLSVAEVHRQVMEQVVEVDDAAMEKYLEEGAVDPTTLHGPLEKALREGHLIPVCFVSARTGAGVQDLLDVMVRHLPNPAEGNPPLFVGRDGAPFKAEPDPRKHVLAHVFKVVNDPYVGKIGI
ncbi:MAG: GTP-binding protein, partial [Betaproteobacteria bacterium]